jgi:hypothetical protein
MNSFSVWIELIVSNDIGRVSFSRFEDLPFQPRVGDEFIFGNDVHDEAYLFPVVFRHLSWNQDNECFWAKCCRKLDGEDNDCSCKIGDGCCRDLDRWVIESWLRNGWTLFESRNCAAVREGESGELEVVRADGDVD